MIKETADKRRFLRVKVQASLHYQVRGRPEFGGSVAENISVGGLSFINNKFISPNTLLTLEINVLCRALRSTARIAWAIGLPYGNGFRNGVEFLEIDNSDKKYLADYINMQVEKL